MSHQPKMDSEASLRNAIAWTVGDGYCVLVQLPTNVPNHIAFNLARRHFDHAACIPVNKPITTAAGSARNKGQGKMPIERDLRAHLFLNGCQ